MDRNHPKHYLHALLAALIVAALLWLAPSPSPLPQPALGWTNPNQNPPDTPAGFVTDPRTFPNLGVDTTTPMDRLTVGGGNFLQTDPVNPIVIGGHHGCNAQDDNDPNNGPFCNRNITGGSIVSLAIAGNYLYAAAYNRVNPTPRFRTLDVSDPTHPRLLGGHSMDSDPHMPSGSNLYFKKIVVSGRYAYAIFTGTGENAFRIIDLSIPMKPFIIGGYNLSSGSDCNNTNKLPPGVTPTDLAVSGKFAYVTFDGSNECAFRILDISDPVAPQVIGGESIYTDSGLCSVNPDGCFPQTTNPISIGLSGKYAYVVFDAASNPTTNNAFRVIDISNPEKPLSVGGGQIGTSSGFPEFFTAYQIAVAGRYAYIGFRFNGTFPGQGPIYLQRMLRIVDVSNPVSPAVRGGAGLQDPILSNDDTDGDGLPTVFPQTMAVSGQYLFLGLRIDLPDDTPIPPTYLDEVGRQFRVIDISDPDSPRIAGGDKLLQDMPARSETGSDESVNSLAVSGRYIYLGFPFFSESDDNIPSRMRILRTIDVTGLESVSLQAHSLETGSLQVVGNAFVGNNLDVRGSLTVGAPAFFQASTTVGVLNVVGYLNKPAGSFLIDHPLDPLRKILRHSFVESPDMKNIYDGTVTLNEKGEAAVELPDYFTALNRDYRYLLTPIGSPAPNLYVKEKIKNNRFVIAGHPYLRVSWQVTGIRQDPFAKKYPIAVEEEKEKPGYYLYPELFGP